MKAWRIAICAIAAAALAEHAVGADLRDRLREASSAAAALAVEAGTARDIALLALDNAFAARRDAEAALVAAMRVGNPRKVLAAREQSATVDVSVGKAIQLASSVVENVGVVLAACESVKIDTRESGVAKTDREVEQVLARTRRLLDEAERSYRRITTLLDVLKGEWLIPAALQPPEPAPPPASGWWPFRR